jgi:sec-independent protein translocase protein TatA
MLVVLIVAVLLFGKRLPEVGRSLGKGIVEFKKGIRGIEDELDSAVNTPAKHSSTYSSEPYGAADSTAPTAPKFEPPTSAPVPHSEFEPQPYQD